MEEKFEVEKDLEGLTLSNLEKFASRARLGETIAEGTVITVVPLTAEDLKHDNNTPITVKDAEGNSVDRYYIRAERKYNLSLATMELPNTPSGKSVAELLKKDHKLVDVRSRGWEGDSAAWATEWNKAVRANSKDGVCQIKLLKSGVDHITPKDTSKKPFDQKWKIFEWVTPAVD